MCCKHPSSKRWPPSAAWWGLCCEHPCSRRWPTSATWRGPCCEHPYSRRWLPSAAWWGPCCEQPCSTRWPPSAAWWAPCPPSLKTSSRSTLSPSTIGALNSSTSGPQHCLLSPGKLFKSLKRVAESK